MFMFTSTHRRILATLAEQARQTINKALDERDGARHDRDQWKVIAEGRRLACDKAVRERDAAQVQCGRRDATIQALRARLAPFVTPRKRDAKGHFTAEKVS